MPRYSATVVRHQYAYVEFDPVDWVDDVKDLIGAAEAAAYEQGDWDYDGVVVDDVLLIEED